MSRCNKCGGEDAKYSCSKCKSVSYCSKSCQLEDWPLHKGPCKSLRPQPALQDPSALAMKSFSDKRALSKVFEFRDSSLPNAGKGCFSKKAFKKGQTIDFTPGDNECIKFCNDSVKPDWKVFFSKSATESELDASWNQYNTASREKANVDLELDGDQFKVLRDIAVGDEIFRSYGIFWVTQRAISFEDLILSIKLDMLTGFTMSEFAHLNLPQGDELPWREALHLYYKYFIDNDSCWIVGIEYKNGMSSNWTMPEGTKDRIRPDGSYTKVSEDDMVLWRQRLGSRYNKYKTSPQEYGHPVRFWRDQFIWQVKWHDEQFAQLQARNKYNYEIFAEGL